MGISEGFIVFLFGISIGALVGHSFERSSYMSYFTGHPMLSGKPGETYVYRGPLAGMFTIIGGCVGALAGAIVGFLIERKKMNVPVRQSN